MRMQMICATFRRWRARRQRKAAIRDLRALNDRTLKDMGLTRGEIIAAVDGRVYRGEQVRPEEPAPPPSPRAARPARLQAIDAAALRGHVDRARQRRAEYVADLLRRGGAALVRLLCRAGSARLRRKLTRRPTVRPLVTTETAPMQESRHARRPIHAA